MEQARNPLFTAMYELPLTPALDEQRQDSPSPIERLRDAVDAHARAEADALGQYQYLAERSGDPVVALLMRLVLEDEERHHGLLRRITATLDDAINWTRSADALPTGTPPAPNVPALVELARVLGAEERTGARILKELAERQRDIDGGVHTLLLDIMAMDSEKHAMVLQFVQDRLERRATIA